MKAEIKKTTLGQYLQVALKAGESFFVEPGGVMSIRGEVEIKTGTHGSLVGSLLRAATGGEGLFVNKIEATTNAVVEVVPPVPSEIMALELKGNSWILGDGSYLAHTGEVEISSRFGGLDAIFSGQGLFFLKASGHGTVYIAGGDSIMKAEVKDGEVFYLDNNHFLAAPEGTEIEKVIIGKGLLSKVASGEGIMFRIYGPATIYYRAGSLSAMAQYLLSHIHGRR